MRILERFLRDHANRTATRLQFLEEGVIPEAGRDRVAVDVIADHTLDLVIPRGFVLLAVGVFGVGLEVQEVSTDRTVAVLEARQDDAVLHLRHLRADLDRQRIR